jgi:HPt (histidine-containing phosphotransfer) domain-containing protein
VRRGLVKPDRLPPVDIEGFRETMRAAGIEEIVGPTLEVFIEEGQVIFSDLSAAVLAGNSESISAHAHALKSSSRNILASGLADLLDELEAQAGDLNTAADIFGRIKPGYDSVMAYLAGSGTDEAPPPA